jgi:hypothetical protein
MKLRAKKKNSTKQMMQRAPQKRTPTEWNALRFSKQFAKIKKSKKNKIIIIKIGK